MATPEQRYQAYLSSVGEDARAFLQSLDARTEDEVRGMLARDEFGRRPHLARIWLDFRRNIRIEESEATALRRINVSIADERSTEAIDAHAAAARPSFVRGIAALLPRFRR